MIPKIIHYCWFGGKTIPSDVQVYIDSWKKYLPEFEIKEWNESNFDVNAFAYTREAYYAKKYAYVSDVARLKALVEEGGLYLDTDILIKKEVPREWFDLSAFGSFEHESYVATGVMACEAGHPIFSEFYRTYQNRHFIKGITYDLKTNVRCLTDIMSDNGFKMTNYQQTIKGFTVFPQILLCGKDWQKGRYDNDDTIMLHDFKNSWGQEIIKNKTMFLIKMFCSCLLWNIFNKYTYRIKLAVPL